MRTRQQIEKLENDTLAPYAMKSMDSAGRVYSQPKDKNRTCYQRDRDRIVHCEAFRKLEYKTQVFAIFEGDYYRTRLTHSIEVAQIARTIARNLSLNEDLVEAIALAHDLGHPPFGHAGEDALNGLMSNIDCKFNHNFRSFEIVTKHEKKYPDFDGLNLSEEVLVGILKHETGYDVSEDLPKYRKKGPTLEACVVDFADALAYISHDIDDGLTSGCITKEDLMDNELWKKTAERLKKTLKSNDPAMFKYQMVRSLIDIQIKDFLSNSEEKLNKFDFSSSKEVQDYYHDNPQKTIIDFSSQMKKEKKMLQALVHKKLYQHYRVERMKEKAKRIIGDIFETYEKNPEQLSPELYNKSKKYSKPAKYKIICDYIAGMTDRFALDEYKRLYDPYKKV